MTAHLKPRRRVLITAAAGRHVEKATLVRTYTEREKRNSHVSLDGWWIVRFEHGGKLAVHQDSIQPVRA